MRAVLTCGCLPHMLSLRGHVALLQVGITEHAVDALLKAGDIKAAIDCCVLLNQWDRAVELAEEHDFPQIAGLLSKYASHLLESNKPLAAIELYRKANKATESAKLLAKLAQEVAQSKVRVRVGGVGGGMLLCTRRRAAFVFCCVLFVWFVFVSLWRLACAVCDGCCSSSAAVASRVCLLLVVVRATGQPTPSKEAVCAGCHGGGAVPQADAEPGRHWNTSRCHHRRSHGRHVGDVVEAGCRSHAGGRRHGHRVPHAGQCVARSRSVPLLSACTAPNVQRKR